MNIIKEIEIQVSSYFWRQERESKRVIQRTLILSVILFLKKLWSRYMEMLNYVKAKLWLHRYLLYHLLYYIVNLKCFTVLYNIINLTMWYIKKGGAKVDL